MYCWDSQCWSSRSCKRFSCWHQQPSLLTFGAASQSRTAHVWNVKTNIFYGSELPSCVVSFPDIRSPSHKRALQHPPQYLPRKNMFWKSAVPLSGPERWLAFQPPWNSRASCHLLQAQLSWKKHQAEISTSHSGMSSIAGNSSKNSWLRSPTTTHYRY